MDLLAFFVGAATSVMNLLPFNTLNSLFSYVGIAFGYGTLYTILRLIHRRMYLEPQILDLTGKIISVTGCDHGFGRTTARMLSKKGALVIAACLGEKGEKSVKEAGPDCEPKNIITTCLNLLDKDSIIAYAEFVKEEIKSRGASGLYGHVNNAGLFKAGPVEWFSDEWNDDLIKVNFMGMVKLTKRLLKPLGDGQGRLVALSSVSGIVPGPFVATYSATKAASDFFHSSVRMEMERDISIHLITPGSFKTPLISPEILQKGFNTAWAQTSDDIKSDYGQKYFDELSSGWINGVDHYAGEDTNWVPRHVVHALSSKYPRSRYYTGWDSILFFSLVSTMPLWLQDRVFRTAHQKMMKKHGGDYRIAVNYRQDNNNEEVLHHEKHEHDE